MATRESLLETIRDEHAQWKSLVAEIGEARMVEPGAVGEWTFKDLVAHLNGWTERRIRRLEAGPGSEATNPWPANLTEIDQINRWIDEQNRDRPVRELLDEADSAFTRLEAAVAALPEEDIATPGRFRWLNGKALAEVDLFEHLHEEHEPDILAWLSTR